MSLKFPFKFKHVLSGDEYLAAQDNNDVDSVVVSWIDNAGLTRSYSLSDVKHYINYKNWVIIEQPSPLVEITQADYDSMIEEINLLQELLAEANNRIVDLENKSKFKPVKDMTFEDWEEAKEEGYKFKTRRAGEVEVKEVDACSVWAVRTQHGWHRIDGTFNVDHAVAEDIIERIS